MLSLDALDYLHIGVVSKEYFRLKSNLKTSRLALQPPFFAHPIHCIPVDPINPGEKYLLLEENLQSGHFVYLVNKGCNMVLSCRVCVLVPRKVGKENPNTRILQLHI